jgi:predicted acyltransferase
VGLSNHDAYQRALAIDAFRGLTVMVMVFTLAHVQGAPSWLRHAPPDTNDMTVPDVVFPAFLFITGMAIPLAVELRLIRGDSPSLVTQHVLTRALGRGCSLIPHSAAWHVSIAAWLDHCWRADSPSLRVARTRNYAMCEKSFSGC